MTARATASETKSRIMEVIGMFPPLGRVAVPPDTLVRRAPRFNSYPADQHLTRVCREPHEDGRDPLRQSKRRWLRCGPSYRLRKMRRFPLTVTSQSAKICREGNQPQKDPRSWQSALRLERVIAGLVQNHHEGQMGQLPRSYTDVQQRGLRR